MNKKILFYCFLFFSYFSYGQYCDYFSVNCQYDAITNVSFGTINNNSTCDSGYEDYTSHVATVETGQSYTISVTIEPDGDDYIYAFFDWNQNGVFDDTGEVYTIIEDTGNEGPHTLNIPVPETATHGSTRFRVIIDWDSPGADPCDISSGYGEVEDYGLTVVAGAIECAAPVSADFNPQLVAVDNDSAELSWELPTETPTNGYDYYVAANGASPNESTIPDGDLPTDNIMLSSLNADTSYGFWIRSDCDTDGYSNWSLLLSFDTISLTTLPWFEPFETFNNPGSIAIIEGFWEVNQEPHLSNADGFVLQKYIYYNDGASVIETPIVGTATNGDELSFIYRLSDYGYEPPYNAPDVGTGEIVISISTDFGMSFSEFETIPNNGISGWQQYSADLSAYENEAVQFKIEVNPEDLVNLSYYAGFDNFYIGSPTCPQVLNLSVDAISDTSVTLSWDALDDTPADGYDYYYSASSTPPTDETIPFGDTTNTSISIPDLTPGETYYFWVRANCGSDNVGRWSAVKPFATEYLVETVWEENFDIFQTPTGWNISRWTIGTGANIPGSQGNVLYRNMANSTYDVIDIFTTLNVTPIQAGDELSFVYATKNYSDNDAPETGTGEFVVFISTDFGATYIEIETVGNDGNTGWKTFEYDLADYIGEKVKIKVRASFNYGDYYLAFDQFRIGTAGDCDNISSVTVGQRTLDTAEISWEEPSQVPANGYDYYLSTENINPNNETTPTGNVNDTEVLLDNLIEGETYYFWVRSNCDTDSYSNWNVVTVFSTQLLVETPWIEYFQEAEEVPQGWTAAGWDIGNYGPAGDNNANTISKHLFFSFETGVITTLNVGEIAQYDKLLFNYQSTNPYNYDNPAQPGSGRFTVSLSTDFGATFTSVATFTNDGSSGWQDFSYELDDYIGEHVQVKIDVEVLDNSLGGFKIWFDDFIIDARPPCIEPTDLATIDLTDTTVTLDWESNDTSFELEWGETGFTQGEGTLVDDIEETEYALEGLTSETEYEFYVRTICQYENSDWVGPIAFETKVACPENITLVTQSEVNYFGTNFEYCPDIVGNLTIGMVGGTDITDLTPLTHVTSVGGYLHIIHNENLTSLEGLENITSVNEEVVVFNNGVTSLTGLDAITITNGYLRVSENDDLTSLSGLEGITSIGGFLQVTNNAELTSIEALENVTTIGNYLQVDNNPQLSSLSGLENLTSVEGNLIITSNASLSTLNALNNLVSIDGYIRVNENDILATLSGLDAIDSSTITDLFIQNNDALNVCNLDNLCLYLSDVDNPRTIVGNLGACLNEAAAIDACSFCFVPEDLSVEDVLVTEALVSWSPEGDETEWLVRYGEIGFDVETEGTSETVNDTAELQLTNLSPDTTYDLYVKAICEDENEESDWTDVVSFETLPACLENLTLISQAEVNAFGATYAHCPEIIGDLIIGDESENHTDITDLSPLEHITTVGGKLYIVFNEDLTSAEGLENLTSVGGNLVIAYNGVTSLSGLQNITTIGGALIITNNHSLPSLTGLNGVTSIEGYLAVDSNSILTSFSGLDNVTSITGGVNISANQSLLSVSQLDNLTATSGLYVANNTSLTSLIGFEGVTSFPDGMFLVNNTALTSLEGLDNLTAIDGTLSIGGNSGLTSLSHLQNLTSIDGFLIINNNISLPSLTGLENIDAESIYNLQVKNNPLLQLCDLPNLCTYLSNPDNLREIVNNAEGCGNEATIMVACGATYPYNETEDIYTLTIQEAIDVSACNVENSVFIPSGDYSDETVDASDPCYEIFFGVGASPGCATIGTMIVDNTDTIEIEIEGLTACTEFDQYEITTALTLNDAVFDIQFTSGYLPDQGDSWMIFNNTFGGAATGTFGGLAEGDVFTVAGFELQITYAGGDGNDIVLSTASCPDVTTADVAVNQEEDIVTLGSCEYTFTWTEPTFTGGCGSGISVTRTLTPVSTVSDDYIAGQVVTATVNSGITTVTYEAEDNFGNTETFTFTLTANDVENPDITCVGNQVVNTDLDACSYTHNGIGWDATATDNCAVDTITYVLTGATTGTGNSLNNIVFETGITTVTWTVTDTSGNTNDCFYTVTVEDNQSPTMQCVANLTIALDANGQAIIDVDDIDDGSFDNCSIDTMTLNQTDFDCSHVGDNTVTLTVTDIYGNSNTCNTTVTVEDNTAPTVLCVDLFTIELTLNQDGIATITAEDIDNGSYDNCTIDTIELSKTTFTCADVGDNMVTLTVTDIYGNVGTCFTSVYVEDSTDPTAQCVAPFSIQLDANGEASIDVTDINDGSFDNCAIASIEISQSEFDCDDLGENTITLTVTDEHDNVSTCTTVVTVEDTIIPTAICVNDFTLALDVNGVASITPEDINNGSFDNCDFSEIQISQSTFDCSHIGENEITLTVTDLYGNSNTCTTTVTIEDTMLPTVQCVAPITIQLDANGEATIDVTDIDNGSFDNCSIATMTLSQTEFDCSHVGDNTVTLTVTDINGNINTCDTTVSIEDNTAPTALCENLFELTIQLDANGMAMITPQDVNNGSFDNCDIATMALSKTTFDCSDVGYNMIILTVTDVNGNESSCFTSVTVEDTMPATAQCVAPFSIQLDANGEANIDVTDINDGSFDNCDIATMILSQTDFDCSHVGDNTVTLTVTDVNGNSSTCTTTVTVEDNIAPIAQCVAPITIQLDANGEASIDVTDINDGSFDNCDIATMMLSQTDFDCSHVGDNTVTLTVTDANGNVSTCMTTVTVEDTIAPIAQCVAPITIQLDANGEASIDVTDINDGSFDNCDIATMALSQTDFDCSHVGDNTVMLTITDINGNTSTCTTTVTVEDTIAPIAQCVAPITIQLDANGEANIDVTDINDGSFDNCDIATMTLSQADFDCSHVGDNTVMLTITDINGNSSTCTTTVTVEDTIAPIAQCVAPITIQLDANGEASIDVADINDGSFDNCDIATMMLSQTEFDCSHVGDNTVTLTVTDANGNVSTCMTTVTVEDNIAPIAQCVPPIIVQLDTNGEASIEVADINDASFDNCDIATMTLSQTDFDCSHVGDNTVILTVIDVNGNSSTCFTTVIVEDTIAPIAQCVAPFTIALDANGEASIDVTDIDDSSFDNCDVATVTIDQTMLDCSHIGDNTVTLTVTDVNGNSSTCSATVTVEDNSLPTPDVATLPDITDYCAVLESQIPLPTATDNCAGVITATTTDPLNYTAEGTYTITWTYDDGNGNTAQQNQTIVVEPSDIATVTFADASFTYDGTAYSIYVDGLPGDAEVVYDNNNQTEAGTYLVTATVSSVHENCGAIVLTAEMTIEKATQTITFNPIPIKLLETDDDFQLQATASSGLAIEYTYTYNTEQAPATVTPDGWVELLTSGEIEITAHQSGNDNYEPAVSVIQPLFIESEDASIHEIWVGGELFENPDKEIFYVMDCTLSVGSIDIVIETETNATVLPSANFTIETPVPGIYRHEVEIISQNGEEAETYTIVVEKQFNFDDIVVEKFDNTLLVNNNPETNGGYEFVEFYWYRDGQLIGNEQYYSAGDNASDFLDPNAEYHVEIMTVNGDLLSTCTTTIVIDYTFNVTLTPNPVETGKSIVLTADYPNEVMDGMRYTIYTLSGQVLLEVPANGRVTEIQLPQGTRAATYIVKSQSGEFVNFDKLIVK